MEVNAQLLSGKVGIAVSGGMDSMALLHWCAKNHKNFSFTPVAVNLDHGIRGETSARDSRFVKEYCLQNNIPLIQKVVNVLKDNPDGSLENNARKARYEFFNQLINENQVDIIATAHHQEDQAETVLFNIFRGSGLRGARGIARTNNKIVRPLLNVPKSDIEKYIKENNIPYVQDETNLDQAYSRNYIRHTILPAIKERFPAAAKNIAAFAQALATDQQYLELLSPSPKKVDNGLYYPADFAALPYPLLSRSVLKGLENLGVFHDIEKIHIDNFLALYNKEVISVADIKSGVKGVKLRDGGILMFKDLPHQDSGFEAPFKTGETVTPTGILKIELINTPPQKFNDGALYVDGDLMPQDCVIRYRREGDKTQLLGGGTTTLKKLYQNKDIDSYMRNALPVIAQGNEVYVVAGVEISGKVKLTDKTKKIYKITFRENTNGKAD